MEDFDSSRSRKAIEVQFAKDSGKTPVNPVGNALRGVPGKRNGTESVPTVFGRQAGALVQPCRRAGSDPGCDGMPYIREQYSPFRASGLNSCRSGWKSQLSSKRIARRCTSSRRKITLPDGGGAGSFFRGAARSGRPGASRWRKHGRRSRFRCDCLACKLQDYGAVCASGES